MRISDMAIAIASMTTMQSRANNNNSSSNIRSLSVVDFGCGKGGDIGKWLKCGVGKAIIYVL
jgi:hypothetical protein